MGVLYPGWGYAHPPRGALKLLPDLAGGDPHARARLLHEARAAASLNHHISARFMK
jgi:hypothetical protein